MKTIIEMAREAGLYLDGENQQHPMYVLQPEELNAFAALVRADEREACAKVCDAEEETANEETWYQCAKELAKQIRARGQEIDPNKWAFDNGLEST
jgi:hypothetical protein